MTGPDSCSCCRGLFVSEPCLIVYGIAPEHTERPGWPEPKATTSHRDTGTVGHHANREKPTDPRHEVGPLKGRT